MFSNLQNQKYYVEARQGKKTNWYTTVELGELIPNTENEQRLMIKETAGNCLTGILKKKWRLVDVTIESISVFEEVDQCEKDDSFEFFSVQNKGVESKGTILCDDMTSDSLEFSWALTAMRLPLSLIMLMPIEKIFY